jgi:hypothetical protein
MQDKDLFSDISEERRPTKSGFRGKYWFQDFGLSAGFFPAFSYSTAERYMRKAAFHE